MITLFKNTVGSIAPLTAIMLPIILGATGLSVDVGLWMRNNRDIQTAVDAAVIAAAWERANGFNEEFATEAGEREAANNGFVNEGSNSIDITFGVNEDGNEVVSADIVVKETTYFSKVLYKGDIFTAVAAASAVITQGGNFCLLSLDESADDAITTVGNVEINSLGCGIAANSSSDSGVSIKGSVEINIDSLSVVGGYDVTGGRAELNAGRIITNGPRIADPYEDLDVPDYGGCDHTDFQISGDGEMWPGVYCGGIQISGSGDILMQSGVYILDGGDFKVTGSGSIIAEGVSIILTDSDNDPDEVGNLEISGSREITFSAPDAGEDMEGVAFFQDRIASDSNQCNSLVGSSILDVSGAIYFPSRCLNIGGNSNAVGTQSDICSRVIATQIKLHGNPNLNNDCDGSAVRDMGRVAVKLIR